MKFWTVFVAALIRKLAIVEEVCNLHGLDVPDRVGYGADVRGPESDGELSFRQEWVWTRGPYSLSVSLEEATHDTGSVTIQIGNGEDCLYVFWTDDSCSNPDGAEDPLMEPISSMGNVSAFAALKNAIPRPGRGNDYSDELAREVLGMICAFFVKLPVDASAEAAATA